MAEPVLSTHGAPVIEVRAGPGGLSAASLRELWGYREVIWAFAARFVKVKYKQAAVGIGWAVLQPVIAAAIFALIFGRYAHVGSDGFPYLVFALCGMVSWSFFSTAVTTSAESLVEDQSLLRKVYFPREALPVGAVGAALVDLAPAILTLIGFVLAYSFTPAVAWIALPLPILLLIVTGTAAGLTLAALNVYYRDVRHALPFLIQIGFFLTPVIYPVSVLPADVEEWFSVLNPVAGAIEAVRDIMLRGDWPDPAITFGALAWSLVLLVVSYVFFKRLERGFSDRV